MWWTRNGSGPAGVELRLPDVLHFARGEAQARRRGEAAAAHHGGGEDDDEAGGAGPGRAPRVSAAGGGPRRPRPALEAGFDRWLDRQLHEIYDPVLDEAIPDEIASLLDRFARRPPPADGPDGPAAPGGGDGGVGGSEKP